MHVLGPHGLSRRLCQRCVFMMRGSFCLRALPCGLCGVRCPALFRPADNNMQHQMISWGSRTLWGWHPKSRAVLLYVVLCPMLLRMRPTHLHEHWQLEKCTTMWHPSHWTVGIWLDPELHCVELSMPLSTGHGLYAFLAHLQDSPRVSLRTCTAAAACLHSLLGITEVPAGCQTLQGSHEERIVGHAGGRTGRVPVIDIQASTHLSTRAAPPV